MYKIIKPLFIALAVAIAFGSCKDDEPTAISASEVAGDYVAVTATYLLHADGSITTTSETGDIDLDIDLVKVNVSGKTVSAKDSDGNLIFESRGLVEAANGVVWNLALSDDIIQDFALLGYTVAGYEKYEMDGKKYQAFYDASDKTIDFSLVLINSNEEIPDIVLEFACSK
jgi:hypothetical protein